MKRTDSGSSATDDFSFDTQTANVEVTRGERLRNFYDEYVYKPAIIAWDDRRTRWGGGILFLYILMATVGVWLYEAPELNQEPYYVAPLTNINAPLGSTGTGVDVLGKAIHATPAMLLLVGAGAVFATVIGTLLGAIAGYKGGAVDRAVTSFSDIAMTIPGLPIVVVLAYGFQISNPLLVGPIIMINYWAGLARTLRSEVLKLRESSYVEASRAMGVSTPKILSKDIIPNIMPYVMVNFAFAARYVVFASVGLYYIGVLPSSLSNWGLQMRNAILQDYALSVAANRYLVIIPMIFIAGLALGLVLLAQGLDRLFNPRVRTRLSGESESTVEGEEENITGGGF